MLNTNISVRVSSKTAISCSSFRHRDYLKSFHIVNTESPLSDPEEKSFMELDLKKFYRQFMSLSGHKSKREESGDNIPKQVLSVFIGTWTWKTSLFKFQRVPKGAYMSPGAPGLGNRWAKVNKQIKCHLFSTTWTSV